VAQACGETTASVLKGYQLVGINFLTVSGSLWGEVGLPRQHQHQEQFSGAARDAAWENTSFQVQHITQLDW
jgi:hypothetical protein